MKKILIVGGTSAIAAACARRWAAEKASFFLVGRDGARLDQVAADLRARGAADVATHALDVGDVLAHRAMLDAGVAALGRLDIALLAHGTLPDQQACERDAALALEEFKVNGLSTIALLTILANQFEAQGCGTIAVITSVAGDRGRPSNYLYGSAKAAVNAFCEGMRARLFKRGVHVLTIKPGFVDTPMTAGLPLPGPLVATPEKVAIDICKAVASGKDTLYTPWFWFFIMAIIRSIPQYVFKRKSL